jgi:chromosome segregation ATPase
LLLATNLTAEIQKCQEQLDVVQQELRQSQGGNSNDSGSVAGLEQEERDLYLKASQINEEINQGQKIITQINNYQKKIAAKEREIKETYEDEEEPEERTEENNNSLSAQARIKKEKFDKKKRKSVSKDEGE